MSKPWYDLTVGEIRESKRVVGITPRAENIRARRIARSYDRLVAEGRGGEAETLWDDPAPVC